MLTDRAQSCMATRCLRHRVWSELSRTTLDVHFRGGGVALPVCELTAKQMQNAILQFHLSS